MPSKIWTKEATGKDIMDWMISEAESTVEALGIYSVKAILWSSRQDVLSELKA